MFLCSAVVFFVSAVTQFYINMFIKNKLLLFCCSMYNTANCNAFLHLSWQIFSPSPSLISSSFWLSLITAWTTFHFLTHHLHLVTHRWTQNAFQNLQHINDVSVYGFQNVNKFTSFQFHFSQHFWISFLLQLLLKHSMTLGPLVVLNWSNVMGEKIILFQILLTLKHFILGRCINWYLKIYLSIHEDFWPLQ